MCQGVAWARAYLQFSGARCACVCRVGLIMLVCKWVGVRDSCASPGGQRARRQRDEGTCTPTHAQHLLPLPQAWAVVMTPMTVVYKVSSGRLHVHFGTPWSEKLCQRQGQCQRGERGPCVIAASLQRYSSFHLPPYLQGQPGYWEHYPLPPPWYPLLLACQIPVGPQWSRRHPSFHWDRHQR